MLKAFETSGNILFEEKQKYPKWIGVIIRVGMFITAIGMFLGLLSEKNKTDILIALVIVVPIIILLLYLSSKIELEKVVTSNGLYYKWRPWHKKFRIIEKEDVKSVESRRFPFLSYGFGWFPGYGRYSNASQGEGLQLYLKNGKRFYFSTADIDSFKRAMNHLINPLQNQLE